MELSLISTMTVVDPSGQPANAAAIIRNLYNANAHRGFGSQTAANPLETSDTGPKKGSTNDGGAPQRGLIPAHKSGGCMSYGGWKEVTQEPGKMGRPQSAVKFV